MRKLILKILITLFMTAVFSVNLFSMAEKRNEPDTVPVDLTLTRELSSADLQAVESEIKNLEFQRKKRLAEEELRRKRAHNKAELMRQLKNGDITFRKLFSSTLFAGDSLLAGLDCYGIIGSGNAITKVGASLYHLEDNIDKIVANNPEKLVLHYGCNMLEPGEERLSSFINMYTGLLKELHSRLPGTEIYVSSILNVATEIQPQYPEIRQYNEAMRKMCAGLNVHFVDNSSILPGDGHYYEPDGTHVCKDFYTDEWLPFFCLEMELC